MGFYAFHVDWIPCLHGSYNCYGLFGLLLLHGASIASMIMLMF